MNTDQIATFLKVASVNSFSKAADLLYKSQPAISRTIATLEKELNVDLLKRQPHHQVELTDAGLVYYDVFSRFFSDMANAEDICRNYKDSQSMLRLGHAPYWITSFFLPQIHHILNESEILLNISVECHEFNELAKRVYDNNLDMAITIENDSIAEYNLNSVYLCNLPKVIVYSNLIVKNGDDSGAALFRDKDFLLYNHPSFNHQKKIIQRMSEELGFVPNVKRVVNVASLDSQLMAGMGVVVLDKWCQQLAFPSLKYYALNSYHRVVMIYRNDSKYKQIIENIAQAEFKY